MWLADGLHRVAGGHIVPAGSTVPALRSRDDMASLQVGHGATVQGGIDHAGAVVLGRGAVTWGDIQAGHEAILAASSQVHGSVQAEGRIVVLDGAKAGALRAGGDVLLLGACDVGDVDAVGDIIIVGSPKAGALRPGGRIATRPY